MTTPLDDPIGEAQRRGDFWKRMAERMEADRDRADKALAQAIRRSTALDAVLARVRQMTDAWEQKLPETIVTATAVEALRTALERADSAPPLDHRQQLDRAVAHLRSITVDCTALTGPVWYGEGWNGAIRELEEYASRVDALETVAPGPAIPPGGNAEDCPRCFGTNPPCPFLCPGHPAQESRP